MDIETGLVEMKGIVKRFPGVLALDRVDFDLFGLRREEESRRIENANRKGKLNGVSLRVRKGEIVSVIGLMGAGNTGLGRAICDIDPCDALSVCIEGRAICLT
jgi:ABC-type sugar transport system ATPase subunit